MADVSKITGSNGVVYDIKDIKARGSELTQAEYDALELAGEVDPEIEYNITDRNGAVAKEASDVNFDPGNSGLESIDVNSAILEVNEKINNVNSNTLMTNVYYEKTGNIVQINFVGVNIPANTGSFANRYVVGTLPVGYRPSNVIHVPWVNDNIGTLRISPEGEVSIRNFDTMNVHDAYCNAIFIASN